MAIGNMSDLVNAAQGRFKPRTIPAMQEPDTTSPYRQAFQRLREGSYTSSDVARGQYKAPTGSVPYGFAPPTTPMAYSMPATQSYQTLVGGYRPSPSGLSSKGKYGGFLTASDRDAAIAGAAMELSSSAPTMLRSQAEERYNQVEDLRSRAFNQMMQKYTAGAERSPRAFEEISQYRAPGLREYGTKLADWYTSNLKPAEEFLSTAQQIEITPVSRLAAAIAANAYGMNPQLAMGKFSGLDKTAFEERRNLESLQTYGIPYEEYSYMQQQGRRNMSDTQKQQIGSIESITGAPVSQIINQSGMDQGSILRASSQQNIKISENEIMPDVSSVVGLGIQYLDNNDQESLNSLIDGIQNIDGRSDVARLITAILANEARKRERSTTYLQNYATLSP